jgi:Coenzyme PQQ synthesis protein D (PqqD)
MRFEVCEPQVVHETIDGEVVAINLETGAYYSLRDSAAAIWAAVERAASVDDVVATVESGFDGEGIAAEARRFLADLEREGLIRPAARPPETVPESSAPSRPFTPPVLERYDDMEDLLLLDPVHDVDAQGWPQPAPRP